jgi:hypothetical protein
MKRAILAAFIGWAGCAAAATPDLSGVWKLATPVQALLTVDGSPPPLLPAAQSVYDAHKAARARNDLSWDPAQTCKPPGEPRTMIESAWPFEIVQDPRVVEFFYQWNHLVRQVAVQPKQDRFIGPFYYGQSVGHWEGNAFVVDVVGVDDSVFLDPSGLPHSGDLHMTERFQLQDGGLELKIRFEDPKTFAKPWETKLMFVRQPAGSITEDIFETRLHQQARYPVLPDSLYPR